MVSDLKPWERWMLKADEDRLERSTLAEMLIESTKPRGTRWKEMAARYLADSGRYDEMRDWWEISGPAGEMVIVTWHELADRRCI
jgi:hypothetical protein